MSMFDVLLDVWGLLVILLQPAENVPRKIQSFRAQNMNS